MNADSLTAKRGEDVRRALAGEERMQTELPRLVCCWCDPPHVMREGTEPASHGACPIGIAKFESGDRL
jgi:hypothetical protein